MLEKKGCFFSNIPFQFYFRIHHQEGPRKQSGSELSGTYRLLVYADNRNLLGEILNTIITNTEAPCLEEIAQKT
jgi:hypothetical protein